MLSVILLECLQEKLLHEKLLVCERQRKYLFKSCDSFPNGVLSTKRDVLQRLLHERNWQTRAAAGMLQMNFMNVASPVMFIA